MLASTCGANLLCCLVPVGRNQLDQPQQCSPDDGEVHATEHKCRALSEQQHMGRSDCRQQDRQIMCPASHQDELVALFEAA